MYFLPRCLGVYGFFLVPLCTRDLSLATPLVFSSVAIIIYPSIVCETKRWIFRKIRENKWIFEAENEESFFRRRWCHGICLLICRMNSNWTHNRKIRGNWIAKGKKTTAHSINGMWCERKITCCDALHLHHSMNFHCLFPNYRENVSISYVHGFVLFIWNVNVISIDLRHSFEAAHTMEHVVIQSKLRTIYPSLSATLGCLFDSGGNGGDAIVIVRVHGRARRKAPTKRTEKTPLNKSDRKSH